MGLWREIVQSWKDWIYGCEHDWRANDITRREIFPVCRKCGRNCWYILGYATNSGEYLSGNDQARKVWDRTLFDANENTRRTHEYWSTRDAEGNPL